MNVLSYLAIFLLKILEDCLSTLRLILINNGKKVFGCILQFALTIIWIILTGWVLIDFMKDMFKIVAFSLGALVGSYLGSSLEEKLAIGTNSFIVKIRNDKTDNLIYQLNINETNYINLKNDVFLITSPRKQCHKIVDLVKLCDDKAIIISEKIKLFSSL